MRIDVFTIFPGIFRGPLDESILRRAIERELLDVAVHDIRAHGVGRHRSVDDTPYGGGPGMVMMAPPIFESVEAALGEEVGSVPIILMSASGERFNQEIADELSRQARIALVCGRYEGVDQRVREHLVTRELSVGDYVLTGGELAAAVIIDAVARLLPGVIDAASLDEESHSSGMLEYPHYTRPADYRGWGIPEVLTSGHHGQIAAWRRARALELTRARRPDLLAEHDSPPQACVGDNDEHIDLPPDDAPAHNCL
jgi:tRNA (guanine37-N1)-methyltransferase